MFRYVKMRKKVLIAVVLIIGMISQSMAVLAAVSGIQEQTTVRVAVTDYPAYIAMDEQGKVSGYAYEYLKKIADYTGWNYEYVRMDLAEALEALASGEIDILPGIQNIPERRERMNFSERNMGEGGTVLCVSPESQKYAYNDFPNFDGMKIAALSGSVRTKQVQARFAEYGAEPKFVEFSTDAQAKEALENGTVDAIMMSSIRCVEDLKIVARINSVDLYFGLNKEKPALKTQIDDAMERIHLDAPYYEAKLDEKYYGNIIEQVSLTREEQEYVENVGTIKVAIHSGMNPVEFYDEQTEQFEGIIVDTYRLISEYTGLNFEFVLREDAETVKEQLKAGEIQIIGNIVKDDAIAEEYHAELTDFFFESTITVVLNTDVVNYREENLKVALHTPTPLYTKVTKQMGYENITYYDSYEECINAVNRGIEEMALIPTYCVDRLLNHSYLKKISSFILPDSGNVFCAAISENADKELCSILNKAIRCISQEDRNMLIIDNLTERKNYDTWKDFWADNGYIIMTGGFVIVFLVLAGMGYLLRGRNLANKNLQKMIKEAEYANKAKNDFLSRMSHDMRTPMNAIIGMSALGGDEAEDEKSRAYFQNIHLSADFLMGLINDVLETSKIESGSFTLQPSAYSVADFYRNVESTIVPLCKQKDITFRFETEEKSEGYVWIDCLRFNQIIFNLLTNAVKFTPNGGEVALKIKTIGETETHIVRQFIIRDNGIGMSEQFMQHMYEPFTQEHITLSERTEGSGLGLTIVKKLVELMNGTIKCRNLPEGGTEFTIELSLPICEKPETAEKEGQKKEISGYALAGKKVLLCEDHPINTQIVVKMLEKQGMSVDCAENGEKGVALFAQSQIGEYAVILMDVRMPVMDGLTAATRIRAMERGDAATIPIIAMTANAYEEDKQKAKEAGMNEHFAKPIEPAALYETLAKYLDD